MKTVKPILTTRGSNTGLQLDENGVILQKEFSNSPEAVWIDIFLVDTDKKPGQGDFGIIERMKLRGSIPRNLCFSHDGSANAKAASEAASVFRVIATTDDMVHLAHLSDKAITSLAEYYNNNNKMLPDNVDIDYDSGHINPATEFVSDAISLDFFSDLGEWSGCVYNSEMTVDVVITETISMTKHQYSRAVFQAIKEYCAKINIQRGVQVLDSEIDAWVEENI